MKAYAQLCYSIRSCKSSRTPTLDDRDQKKNLLKTCQTLLLMFIPHVMFDFHGGWRVRMNCAFGCETGRWRHAHGGQIRRLSSPSCSWSLVHSTRSAHRFSARGGRCRGSSEQTRPRRSTMQTPKAAFTYLSKPAVGYLFLQKGLIEFSPLWATCDHPTLQ